MIPKPFDDVTKADIDNLVAQAQAERRTMEYKQDLPAPSRAQDKFEFLADVSSFANASGGDLFFGVEDQRDTDGKPTGIPKGAPGLTLTNPGADALALEQSANANIAPRIPGLRIKVIPGFPGGNVVLLVRVPQSFASPHMVKNGDWGRFYTRANQGKQILDVQQIRAAFALSENISQRLRSFRAERLAAVVAGETPVPLKAGPKVVLHLVPLRALDPTTRADLHAVANRPEALRPMYSLSWGRRYNFDGVVCRDADCSYAQFFRSGAIEAVDTRVLVNRDASKLLAAPVLEKELMEALGRCLRLYKDIRVEPPVFVLPALLGVRGYFVPFGEFNDTQGEFDRDNLVLPDDLVDDVSADPATVLRPAFDAMWQASGWEGCRHYKKDGTWVGDR
jgi:hypothetical protein